MTDKRQHTVTKLLHDLNENSPGAVDRLFQLVYNELHHLATEQCRDWKGNYTLNTTSLLHEAYELSFEKAGIATFKVLIIGWENNDLNNINVHLSELPTHNIKALEANVVPFATDNSDGSVSSVALQINLTVSNFLAENKNVTRRLFYIFWGENDNVSNTDFEEKTLLVATNDSPDVTINNLDANVFFSKIPSGFINNIPFGSEFHIAIYEVTENSFSYTDPESNSRIFSNMSESPKRISVTNILQ